MISFFNFIAVPLGWLMSVLYDMIGNYGLTLIVFTVLIKLAMLPMAISQQKNMVKTAQISKKSQELQKKYGKNRQKLNEEMSKLYERENYNPMSSCLPLLLQFPILFGLIGVVYGPLTHILHFDGETAASAAALASSILDQAGISYRDYTGEINALKAISIDSQAFVAQFGQSVADAIAEFDFSFLGMFLGDTPNFKQPGILWSIPVLSALSSALASWQSAKQSKATAANSAAANSANSTLLMMPVMSAYMSFVVPAGVGLYWLINNFITVIQTFVLGIVLNPAEMIRKNEEQAAAEREAARQARIEAKKARGQAITEADLTGDFDEDDEDEPAKEDRFAGMSQKEINRIKLAEARKRDAERYGEEYIEVTDEDLK
jgi:YidC/Oxa1 family membrane protein insertase